MAKVRPSFTLLEMEEAMGCKVGASSSNRPDGAEQRFYSDLRPVPNDTYGLSEKNYQEFVKRKHDKDSGKIAAGLLPRAGQSETIGSAENRVILTHESTIGFYRFPLNICYKAGFNLPLLLAEAEAVRASSVAKFHRVTSPSVSRGFFDLPREIRDKIYICAIPRGKWRIADIEEFEQDNLTGGIGDPSGFYYPLSKDLAVLRANKQMRLEALPFAYRRTTFILDDLDDAIKLLVAIGQVGRENIESLGFPWESRTDLEFMWKAGFPPGSGEAPLGLPVLHASRCVQLLRQCKRLKHLRLSFEEELVVNMKPDHFMADPGVKELSSLQGITRLEVWDLGDSSLEHCRIAKLLREKIESGKENQGD